MKQVLVTGAAGFIGRHVVEALRRRPGTSVVEYDMKAPPEGLRNLLSDSDVIVHLAGVNRPKHDIEFQTGNVGLMLRLCEALRETGRQHVFVFSSSIQAALDNPYGASKREAEKTLERWVQEGGGRAIVFRLKNVFGKCGRPNYNSVTATFCHNIAHELPIEISDPKRELELVYIDDVVAALVSCIDVAPARGFEQREIESSYRITLGELARNILSFRNSRRSLVLPSFEDEFTRRLYATYLSYLEPAEFSYALEIKGDSRGNLAEFMKSSQFGQIFVSRTLPGVTRGNHYHHTKTEKFLVVDGEAIVRFRSIFGREVIEHKVKGSDFRVIDIPPGYTHSIENIGSGQLVTLFWSSEIFDPAAPDTFMLPVANFPRGEPPCV